MMIQQAETNKQMMIQQTTTMNNQTTTMNNLMMLMTKNEERRQGSPISEIQPVIELQQGSTPASTLTNSQYSQSQEQSTSSNKRPKHGLDDDETTALSTVENGTSDEPEEGEQEDMIEEQMEATTNEQPNDVTMEDNDPIPAAKQTALAAGDFSQFNNNNKPTTTTNTSAKTDTNPSNE